MRCSRLDSFLVRAIRSLTVAALSFLTAWSDPVSAQRNAPTDTFSFVVLGHIRGGETGKFNYMLDELLREVRALNPDLVFLTGDMIWGDVVAPGMADSAAIRRDWETLDSLLAPLRLPVYRVPGNHDLHDPVTRDIYLARYGALPKAVTYGNAQFLLLNSAYLPTGDTVPRRRRFVRGVQLDQQQIDFVRSALGDTAKYRHAFVFLHHMLWWEPDAPWWKEVHPHLVDGKVRAVFAGDFGPMKFSHERKDGIDYIQSAIEGFTRVPILQNMISSRLLYQQFDNFLHVKVAGEQINVEVRTVGAINGAKYTPQRWREINDAPPLSWAQRVRAVVSSPARAAALIGVITFTFVAGILVGMWLRGSRKRGAPTVIDAEHSRVPATKA